MQSRNQFCTFYLDRYFYGVEVRQVQEVIRYQQMTPVPLASWVIRGLINLRGQIVTAFDMRRRLGLPDRDESQQPMNVVLQTHDGPISLLVDDIGDVLEFEESQMERTPEHVCDSIRQLVRGAYQLPNRLLLILETDRLLNLQSSARDRQ